MSVYEVWEGHEVYGVKSWGYKARERLSGRSREGVPEERMIGRCLKVHIPTEKDNENRPKILLA